MIVAFLHVGTDVSMPALMVRSVRQNMPHSTVVQMTDDATPMVPGVDWMVTRPYDGMRLMTYRLRHLADLPPGPLLTLDTDVLVLKDVSSLFKDSDWDVILTKRQGPILDRSGTDVAKLYPYNTGVMLSREPDFWQDCADWCERAPDDLQRWYGDQAAVKAVAESNAYRVSAVPIDPFNYTPGSPDEDVSNKVVVHFKGRRKEWMKGYGARYLRKS